MINAPDFGSDSDKLTLEKARKAIENRSRI
jgi:hypothetical protein